MRVCLHGVFFSSPRPTSLSASRGNAGAPLVDVLAAHGLFDRPPTRDARAHRLLFNALPHCAFHGGAAARMNSLGRHGSTSSRRSPFSQQNEARRAALCLYVRVCVCVHAAAGPRLAEARGRQTRQLLLPGPNPLCTPTLPSSRVGRGGARDTTASSKHHDSAEHAHETLSSATRARGTLGRTKQFLLLTERKERETFSEA